MAEDQLAERHKGSLKARFAAIVCASPTVRPAHRRQGPAHLPGEEVWLIGEHRMSGEKKYYLANLPANTTCAP